MHNKERQISRLVSVFFDRGNFVPRLYLSQDFYIETKFSQDSHTHLRFSQDSHTLTLYFHTIPTKKAIYFQQKSREGGKYDVREIRK